MDFKKVGKWLFDNKEWLLVAVPTAAVAAWGFSVHAYADVKQVPALSLLAWTLFWIGVVWLMVLVVTRLRNKSPKKMLVAARHLVWRVVVDPQKRVVSTTGSPFCPRHFPPHTLFFGTIAPMIMGWHCTECFYAVSVYEGVGAVVAQDLTALYTASGRLDEYKWNKKVSVTEVIRSETLEPIGMHNLGVPTRRLR